MRLPDAALSQRHVSEIFFTERSRFLLSWDEGPVLGSVQDDGALHIDVPMDAKRAPTDTRIGLDGDAVLYVESREVLVTVHLNDTDVVVVESGRGGRRIDGLISLAVHVRLLECCHQAVTVPQRPRPQNQLTGDLYILTQRCHRIGLTRGSSNSSASSHRKRSAAPPALGRCGSHDPGGASAVLPGVALSRGSSGACEAEL